MKQFKTTRGVKAPFKNKYYERINKIREIDVNNIHFSFR